jgi:hypothetical protein
MGKMKMYSLEYEYKQYLLRMEWDEEAMHPIQRKHIKQTFMAACIKMILLLKIDILSCKKGEISDILDDMLSEGFNSFLEDNDKLN